MSKEHVTIAPEINNLANFCRENLAINPELYSKYEVKRGLRDISGQGVLTGLTEVSEIRSHIMVDRDMVPMEGKLYYHGVDIEDIAQGFIKEKRFGFEEVVYLLLFGKLPSESELNTLNDLLATYREELPTKFVRDVIMKAPSKDMMNALARSVLTLYSYDEQADDTSIENVLRQCLQLIALFPLLSVYGYHFMVCAMVAGSVLPLKLKDTTSLVFLTVMTGASSRLANFNLFTSSQARP